MDATTDLTKLKVLELKRELKIRGLNQTGKRNELLERLQAAIASGVGLEGTGEDDEEFDEDEILAGDDVDDDDSKLTPLEEAAALGTAAKVTDTPSRGRRAAATPRTPALGKRVALRRTETPAKATKVAVATPAAAIVKPAVVSPSPVKQVTPIKTPVKKPASESEDSGEPKQKAIKLSEEAANGDAADEAAKPLTALELRAKRFNMKSDEAAKEERATRFGTSGKSGAAGGKPGKLSMDVGELDMDKLKARANRFGCSVAKSLTQAEVDEQKKARAERFGASETATENGAKKDLTSDAAKAARAAKFATADKPAATTTDDDAAVVTEPIISASGKKIITMGFTADDAAKAKRSARFDLIKA